MQSRTQRWLALKEKASLLHMNHKTCGKAEATQVGSKCLTTWLFFWDRCETSLSCCERCLAPRMCNGMLPSTAVALDLGRVGLGLQGSIPEAHNTAQGPTDFWKATDLWPAMHNSLPEQIWGCTTPSLWARAHAHPQPGCTPGAKCLPHWSSNRVRVRGR